MGAGREIFVLPFWTKYSIESYLSSNVLEFVAWATAQTPEHPTERVFI